MKPSNYSSLNEQTVLYRRELHRIPETGTDLPLTSSYLKKQLTALGVPLSKGTSARISWQISFSLSDRRGNLICSFCVYRCLPDPWRQYL